MIVGAGSSELVVRPTTAQVVALTPRWSTLRHHGEQNRLWRTRWRPLFPDPILVGGILVPQVRFALVPAGRRSGKTEIAKRRLVAAAIEGTLHPAAAFFAAAPTYSQAKRIYWADLKRLVPKALVQSISEGELIIRLWNGSEIHVFGLDKPERIEGVGWDGGVLDEFANMKRPTWYAHVRPTLSDRNGWCWLIGVPEGRNHYYDIYLEAQANKSGEWGAFHWKSIDILDPKEIEAARRDLDPLTFQQEYEASFVNFHGRAYYTFDQGRHCRPLCYNPKAPLIICFDFNVDPGVAAVCQEQLLPNGQVGTGVIGEVYIPVSSNTAAVCRKLIADWSGHEGPVVIYGDPSGGSRSTSQKPGETDWEIVKIELRPHFRRLFFRVAKADPGQRARINAVNARFLAGGGPGIPEVIRAMVDPRYCPRMIKDLDGTRLLEGGSGEIDKSSDLRITHLSDALAYYFAEEFPVVGGGDAASRRRVRVR